jgi:hypothetical protein
MSTTEHAVLGPNMVISPSSSSSHSFLVQVCNLCDEEMVLDTGDVLYGDSWYHSSCWVKADGERRAPSRQVQEPLFIIDE